MRKNWARKERELFDIENESDCIQSIFLLMPKDLGDFLADAFNLGKVFL